MKRVFILIILVSLSGCAGTSTPILFQPVQTPRTFTFYTNGIPIVSITRDSLSLLLSFDKTEIGGDFYFRLWVLAQNASGAITLLEPSKIFTVYAIPKDSSGSSATYWWTDSLAYSRENFIMQPQSPARIMNSINAEEEVHEIATIFGGYLKTLSARPTTITGNHGDTYEVNDLPEKVDAIDQKTAVSLRSISNWYTVFESSMNSGILRKNTLFPGQSINGYLYFLNKMQYLTSDGFSFHDCNPRDFNYMVVIQFPNGSETVEFTPVEDEY